MFRVQFAVLAAGLALLGTDPASARSDTPSEPTSSPKGTINVSCYRGPLKTVAWDRPNAVFIEDLRRYGYSFEQAHVIGERVCRDEYGVDNAQHKIETLKRLLREVRPQG